MRRRGIISLVVVGMFTMAFAAAAQANWYHKSKGAEGTTSGMMAPSSGPGMMNPEVGTHEYREALETGSLPASESARFSSRPRSPEGEEIRIIEAGGVEFRTGVDTGP